MAYWDVGMRNIVDVDGQLLAIDADVISGLLLLQKANRHPECRLWEIKAGECLPIDPQHSIRLLQDEVRFFETPVGSGRR